MKKRIAFLLTLLVSYSPGTAQEVGEDLGAAKELRILYAGDSGGEREQGFLEILRPWFAQVDSIALEDLSVKTAEPFDVVIADGRRKFTPEGEFVSESRSKGNLSDGFNKPIIMIGAVGGEIQRRSKIDWL